MSLNNAPEKSAEKSARSFFLILLILVVIIAITISYKFFDKTAALSIGQFLQTSASPVVVSFTGSYKNLINFLIHSDEYILMVAEFVMVLCLIVPLRMKQTSFIKGAAITSISVILTYLFKDLLKSFFGRCCSNVAKKGSVLLINTILNDKNALFFHFLKGSGKGALFPSGHMAITCSVVTSLCIYFPRLKILWILFAVLMALSLIITNNHFVSDVIAGALLGSLVSFFAHKLFTAQRVN